ncbi:NACHT domain- and WD repeat-containing protein 1 [Malaclemys terrapin pileata]|uniref:NACHT domain- and WD repeat-containing protein 1 n=1 Tax=Malaclemys terrapin pileata TaxID=2991368 RepID=UPI0023A8C775|nr:NACHT domain- and WD repeat-containing protein 1 [Malaclemys terrapin pileata]
MSLSCLSPDTCRDLLQGKMVPLPFQPSSLVRIFISSASSDMATERETLLKAAYPEVQAFCQKHSLMFEVIDLRWGVCDVIDTDHMSTQLCLEEIESCQKLSVGPTFIGLLGDRYGHRPLPRLIEEKEFEALIAQLIGDPTATHLLTFWYWKDENAIPSVYVLQPITDHLPHCHPTANQAQHQADVEVWRSLEKDLAVALRLAAREAEKHGLISQEQRHRYDKSETEWEIEQGLLNTQEIDLAASIFLREVEGLDKHLLEGTSMQLVDTEEDGSLDNEAQQLLRSLKAKIANYYPQHLKVHTVPWNAHPENPRHKGHTKYLKELCEQFITATNHQVLRSLRYRGKSSEEPEGLLQELSHHMMLCLESCRVFCGRQDLLDNILQSIRQNDDHVHTPLILYGPPGCGKTALMCKLSEQVRTLLGQETVVVIRQLGTSQVNSAIHSLLRDICSQVCLAFGLPPLPVQVTQACSDLILFFHNLLLTVSHLGVQSLVLFFDSVDQLIPANGAHRLYWVPKDCPPKVHIVVSNSTAEHGILETLQEAMPEPEAYFEVGPLSREEGGKMLEVLLASVKRKLSPAQQTVLQNSFPEGGHPLLFKLAFNEARRWASYTQPSALMIVTTVQEAMHRLCARLEKLHGMVLVAHMLGYIASSRNGLSDAELKDILSLDDEVLAEIYQHCSPPCKTILRFPPLLWARLHCDIGECLAERQADGFALLGLAHRQFTEVVQNRYLPAQDKTKRHLLLADFFRGTWSWGMKKSLKLPLLGKSLNADRKVAPQPLWFSDTVANRRKLSELPFHLLNAGRIEELKQDVLGNMNWITCKIVATGIQGIANDFAMCNERINCPELRLIQETLLLLKPALDYIDGVVGVSIIYTEMLARLHFFMFSYPDLIGRLCQQCLSWLNVCPHPVLVPLCGFLQPPGGPLKMTITGFLKGVTVLELSSDHRVLVAGSQDGTMVVWIMEDIEVMHTLTGHSAEVRCVKVFGKGTSAVSAAMDYTLRIWNLVSGRQKFSIQDSHSGEQHLYQLHVDERNRIVYSASGAKVNAWHLETGEHIFQISGEAPDAWLCTEVFEPRQVVMTMSEGGTLSLWDSSTGELQSKRQLSGLQEEAPTCSILIQKQGKMIVGFSRGSLSMIFSDGNSLMKKLPGRVRFLVVSEDESLLAAGFGVYVRVFLANSKGFHRFMAADLEHECVVHSAVFSPDNSIIVTGSQGESIQVWSLSEQGLLTDTLDGMETPVTLLALCGHTLVSASHSAPYLKVWDLTYDRKHKNLAPVPDRTGCTAMSHDGNYVYFPQAGERHQVIIWDSTKGAECDTLDTSAQVRCLEVAEQRKLLFTGLVSGTVLVFPLNSRQDVVCIPPPKSQKPINHMALNRQEEQLAIAYDDLVLVLDVSPGKPCPVIDKPIYTFYTQIPAAVISSVAVLANYRVLYGMSSGDLFLYDCPHSKVFPLEMHRCIVTCLETSHGEQWALSGSEDSLQCLWDLELCQWEHEMCYYKQTSFLKGIQCACFSKDDKYVYTGSFDHSITVWDVSSGALLAVQFVYATANRIMPTADGFVATTRLGYIIRERFRCPQSISSQYNPLQNIKATCVVKSRKKEKANPREQHDRGKVSRNQIRTNKLSQNCVTV